MKNNNSDKNSVSNSSYSIDHILQTLNIYLTEYIHRDTHMWSVNYKFFYASLITILLPNIAEWIGITIPCKLLKYECIFPIMGVILAFVYLFVALSLAKRFKAISQTYNQIADLLPFDLRRKKLGELSKIGCILNHQLAYPVFTVMFFALIVIAFFCL